MALLYYLAPLFLYMSTRTLRSAFFSETCYIFVSDGLNLDAIVSILFYYGLHFSCQDFTMCTRKWGLWLHFKTYLTTSSFHYLRPRWIQIHTRSCMFSWNRFVISQKYFQFISLELIILFFKRQCLNMFYWFR